MSKKEHFSTFIYDAKERIYRSAEGSLSAFDYSDGAKEENYILKVIRNSTDLSDNSQQLMSSVRDWPSYYHLAKGRSNILRSFEFFNNAKVLELGSGCGALTRFLGENCKSVDAVEGSYLRAQITRARCKDLNNVNVYCADINSIEFNSVYNIVTLIGVLEYAPKYFIDTKEDAKKSCLTLLEYAGKALAKEGVLIIAIENKVGIKYWSGAPEDHTNNIYDSIYDYPDRYSPVTFSESELKRILNEAGFMDISFYYCFPDYKFPTTIFSSIGDEREFYLHNWVEFPFETYSLPRSYTFHEGLAVKALAEARLLRKMANSFLITARREGSQDSLEPDWIAKRFSTKRLKPFQCVTTLNIKPNIRIEKKRLLTERQECISAENGLKLTYRPTDAIWEPGELMTFDIYKGLFCKEYKRRILDIIREYYNELMNQFHTGDRDNEGYPLLRGEAIDFMPRNIIRTKDGIVPIDNEWHINRHIPADYILYRAIMYDVIDLQKPWLAKKILHYDRYCVETIRCFFKDYGYLRHKKNIILEDNIQNSITSNFNKQPRDALCKNMWNVRAFKSIIKSISHLVPKWLIKFIKRLLY